MTRLWRRLARALCLDLAHTELCRQVATRHLLRP